MDGSRSIFDLNREREEELHTARQYRWRDRQAALDDVRKLVGVPPLNRIQPPTVTRVGSFERSGYRVDKLTIQPATGIVLPALSFQPEDHSGNLILYVYGEGKHVDAAPTGPIEDLVRKGHAVLAVDLSGCGETETPAWRYGSTEPILGHNSAEFFVAYMLGKSLVGLRTEDILTCAAHLRREYPKHEVQLVGVGVNGVPALHAASLEPELFKTLTLRQSLASWRSVIHTPLTRRQLVNAVHGALAIYDLPDLLSVLPAEKVKVESPLDAPRRTVRTSKPHAEEKMTPPWRISQRLTLLNLMMSSHFGPGLHLALDYIWP